MSTEANFVRDLADAVAALQSYFWSSLRCTFGGPPTSATLANLHQQLGRLDAALHRLEDPSDGPSAPPDVEGAVLRLREIHKGLTSASAPWPGSRTMTQLTWWEVELRRMAGDLVDPSQEETAPALTSDPPGVDADSPAASADRADTSRKRPPHPPRDGPYRPGRFRYGKQVAKGLSPHQVDFLEMLWDGGDFTRLTVEELADKLWGVENRPRNIEEALRSLISRTQDAIGTQLPFNLRMWTERNHVDRRGVTHPKAKVVQLTPRSAPG